MTRFAKLKATIDRQMAATPWLRWASLVIVVLLALFLLRALEQVRVASEARATDAEVQLRKMRSLQGQDAWLQRERDAAELYKSLLGEIPVAPTSGQAQAALQAWLADVAASTGVDDVRVVVEGATALDSPPGVVRVRATLRGALPPRTALNVLRRIEGATNLVVIESIEIRDDANRLASITLSAYYRLTTEGAAP